MINVFNFLFQQSNALLKHFYSCISMSATLLNKSTLILAIQTKTMYVHKTFSVKTIQTKSKKKMWLQQTIDLSTRRI